jgi:3',5'-cyclic AMP phosphodiesterase CpdA
VTFLLAHLSDAHLGPLPRPLKRELVGKRLTGYLNWMGGRKRFHDMQVLARLVEDMKQQKPDHVAMTGDILNIGLPGEFATASAWLTTLGEPHDVSFVPGNHDAYTRGSMPYLLKTFAPWTADDRGRGERAPYPYLRRRGAVALIGLASGVPTMTFLASGRLGLEQRQAFERLLEETDGQDLVRIVMIHHPPYRGGATPGRRLIDATAFESIIAAHKIDLIIHGHNHRFSIERLKSAGGTVPIVGVPSASAVPGSARHRAAYHLYAISEGPRGLTIEGRTRGLLPGTREIIGGLGTFSVTTARQRD